MGAVAAFELATFVINGLPGWIDIAKNAGQSVAHLYDLYVKTRAVIAANTGPGMDDWNALDDRATALETRINDTSKDA